MFEDVGGMEAPCQCDNCGNWFDLEDGNPTSEPGNNTVYCNSCVVEPWGKIEKRRKASAKVMREKFNEGW